jgi:Holliday junction resolvase
MTPEQLSQLAFLLCPHLAKPNPDNHSAEVLADRIKGIQRGLLPEDEFSATVCWLGNCAAIHRIDQSPMPVVEMPEKMRAPDFLAFPIHDGKLYPVLIEVKSHHGQEVDWSEKYLLSLKRFAEHLKLPLLLAWKCGGLWTLVDINHFEKNVTGYRLTLGRALTEDLFCLLFRNLRIQMDPDLELRLDFKICEDVEMRSDGLMPEGTYQMEIAAAGFYSANKEIKDYAPEHFWLFSTAPDESEFTRIGEYACRQIFRPLRDHGFTLSNVLVAQLSLGTTADTIDWHTILTKPFPSSGRQFHDALRPGIDKGFVRYVMDIIPNTWPDFLPPRKSAESRASVSALS